MQIYTRMCLLGVSMMNNHIYGSKVSQNPYFGSLLNRHFKPNMRKIQIAISSDLCIRLTWNLTGSCGQQQTLRGWSRIMVKQFQDGGRPPFLKSIYRHISVKNHLILMTFCTQQHILNWVNVTWSKMKKVALDRLRGRQTYFLFSRNSRKWSSLNLCTKIRHYKSFSKLCFFNSFAGTK